MLKYGVNPFTNQIEIISSGSNSIPESGVLSGRDNSVSGINSVIAGGYYNYISGDYKFVGGGQYNYGGSGNYNSIVGGYSNEIYADYATVGGGLGNQNIGESSTIGGGNFNYTDDAYCGTIGGGEDNEVSAKYGTIPGGNHGSAYLHGQLAYSTGVFGAYYLNQFSFLLAKGITLNASATELFLDIDNALRLIIPQYTTWHFSISGIAKRKRTDDPTTYQPIHYPQERLFFQINGLIDRINTPDTTTLVGSQDKILKSGITLPWDINAVADTNNGALRLEVVGEASKEIIWLAQVKLVELTSN